MPATSYPLPPSLVPPSLQRFISRKTVDKVLKDLRESTGGASRPGSRASGSFNGSFSGTSGPSGGDGAPSGGGARPSGSVSAERR